MAAGVSRGRRVLGEKDRNTLVGVGVDVDINNKAAGSLSKLRMGDADTATSSPKAGQKRKLDSVEEDGGQDGSQQSSNSGAAEPLSTLTSLSDAISSCPVYETADGSSPLDVSVGSQADDVLQCTLDTSLSQPPHSQGDAGADPSDTYFEIHEEMSQRTLDKLHAVSLSQPHQQPNILLNPPLALPRPWLAKENSQISVSMSSLIGFDERDGSQEHGDSAEWRIAAARERAAMEQKAEIRPLNDSEMPSLRPTEFSAGQIDKEEWKEMRMKKKKEEEKKTGVKSVGVIATDTMKTTITAALRA
ncbi:hypothetical protein DV736_g4546, partial [Chaetothyriales sp. CBS 134916]